jgi:hypothetical protein
MQWQSASRVARILARIWDLKSGAAFRPMWEHPKGIEEVGKTLARTDSQRQASSLDGWCDCAVFSSSPPKADSTSST